MTTTEALGRTRTAAQNATIVPQILRVFAGILLVGVWMLGLPSPGFAQDDDDPNRPVLPDIAPRVFEIRGQLEIAMPSLERQPLIGFNPPPPVVPIPPDRHPFVESYKQESLDLPPSPLQPPQPPTVASLISRPPRNGLIEGAAGRYVSRMIRFRSEWPLSDPVAVYSGLDYNGSDGHEPFDNLENARASFDALDALVGLQYVASSAAVGMEVDGFFNNYMLFGAEPSVGAGNFSDDPPDREGRGGGVTAWVRTQAASAFDLDARLRYGTTSYETQALASSGSSQASLFDTRESSIEAEADLSIPFAPRQSVQADGGFTGIGRDDDAPAETIRMFDGGAGIKLTAGRGFELEALGRVMTFTAADHKELESGEFVGGGGDTYFSADVLVNLYPTEGLRLYAQNRPHAERHTLNSIYRTNPYLVDAPVVQPTIYTIDARGGAQFVRGLFEAGVYAGYKIAPNFLYFERASETDAYGYGSDLIAGRYDEVAIMEIGGDVSINLTAGLNATVGMTVRDGELVDEEIEIPYFGPLRGYGSISYAFADGRAFVQATGHYESARYVDAVQSRRLGDFFDMDLEGSLDLTPSLGIVARMHNLSAGFLERWEGYPQSPFVLMGGVRVRW